MSTFDEIAAVRVKRRARAAQLESQEATESPADEANESPAEAASEAEAPQPISESARGVLGALSSPEKANHLVPLGYEGGFVPPAMPDGLFAMMWNDDPTKMDGPFDSAEFATDPEGTNIMYSRNGDGHPIYIRCVSKDVTGGMVCMDGSGKTFSLRLVPLNPATGDPLLPPSPPTTNGPQSES